MGRSVPIKFMVHLYCAGVYLTPIAWKGRRTQAALDKFRTDLNASFQPGGSNWHVSQQLRVVPHVHTAHLVDTADRRILLTSRMPAFEVA
jgi:hypothetical protein